MKIKNEKPFIIFSVEREELTEDENVINTYKIEEELKELEIDYKIVKGYYDGVEENCFLVINTSQNNYHTLRIASKYNQESILLVDQFRNAKLYYLDTRVTINLGKWTKIDEIVGVDAWTYDYATGRYYTCQ